MKNTFQILTRFLEKYSDEVHGRAAAIEPPTETREQLQRLARGQLAKPQRDALAVTLKEHPQWVSLLAQEAKAQRTARR